MIKLKYTLWISLFLSVLSTMVSANDNDAMYLYGDLPTNNDLTVAQPVPTQPVHRLSGFYIGVESGLSHVTSSTDWFVTSFAKASRRYFRGSRNNQYINLLAGYSYQLKHLYLGAQLSTNPIKQDVTEPDFISDTGTFGRRHELRQYLSFDLQPGVCFGDWFVIYADAGVSFGREKFQVLFNGEPAIQRSKNIYMPRVGGGFLIALSEHLSLNLSATATFVMHRSANFDTISQYYSSVMNSVQYGLGIRYTF